MKNANPDLAVLRDGFNVIRSLVGLPTFSTDPENGDVLFVLCDWKTDHQEIAVYVKNLGNRRIRISQTATHFDSAVELACFRPIFKDWVNRMIQISDEYKLKLSEGLGGDAPPGWAVPNTEQPPRGRSFGSIADDRRNWEQAQARKFVNFEVEAVRKK